MVDFIQNNLSQGRVFNRKFSGPGSAPGGIVKGQYDTCITLPCERALEPEKNMLDGFSISCLDLDL